MFQRSLLQRRSLLQATLFNTLSSRNLSFSKILTLKSRAGLRTLRPRLPRQHLAISFMRRNAVIKATSTTTTPTSTSDTKENKPSNEDDVYGKVYLGPLDSTFRRLKILSLLSTTLAPFIFALESDLPLNARWALASIAVIPSATGTALVAWCGKPYVTKLRYIRPEENGGAEGMEITTMSLTMKPRITRIHDPSFLVETRRAFAKWELAQKVVLSKADEGERRVTPGSEETIAETRDKDGNPLGRWVVTWGENGEGTCREIGNVVRHFNVHEELLP